MGEAPRAGIVRGFLKGGAPLAIDYVSGFTDTSAGVRGE